MRRKLALLTTILFIIIINIIPLQAQSLKDYDYYISNYDVQLIATNNRTYHITETITCFFNVEKHGIIRSIPDASSTERYTIKDVNVENAPFIYDGYEEIKIGTADAYVKGEVTYIITYTLEHYADTDNDFDYLYTNLLGTETDVPIQQFTSTIILPEQSNIIDTTITSGSYGSTTNEIASLTTENNTIKVTSLRLIEPYEGITLMVKLPEKTFHEAMIWKSDFEVNSLNIDVNLTKDGHYQINEQYDILVNNFDAYFERDIDNYSFRYDKSYVLQGNFYYTINHEKQDFEGIFPRISLPLSKYIGKVITITVYHEGIIDTSPFITSRRFALSNYFSDIPFHRINVTMNSELPLKEFVLSTDYIYNDSENFTYTKNSAQSTETITNPSSLSLTYQFSDGVQFTRRANSMDTLLPITLLIATILSIILHMRFKQRHLIQTVEFYPPNNLNPLELGYIIDQSIDGRDITSLLFYFASHNHLFINVEKKNDFELIKETELDGNHTSYEHSLFDSLFASSNKRTKKSLKNTFYTTIYKVKKLAHESLKASQLTSDKKILLLKVGLIIIFYSIIRSIAKLAIFSYPFNSFNNFFLSIIYDICLILVIVLWSFIHQNRYKHKKISQIFLILLTLLLLFMASASVYYSCYGGILSPSTTMLLIILFPISMVLLTTISTRNEENLLLLEKCLSFKNFLIHAEKDRLEQLLEENPTYYYDILPYAHVLGISKLWEKKFDSLITEPPTWYSSYVPFQSISSLNLDRTFNSISNVSTSAPSSSSGSSGGGYSGGGSSGGGSGGGGVSSW